MNKLKYFVYLIIVFSLEGWKQPDKFKKITLYQGQVSIEVPSAWRYKENYRKFSNYQIKYDAKISHAKTRSTLTVVVYDSSHMYNTPINNDLLDSFKEVQYKTRGLSVKFTEREVIKVDNHDVGLLEYTFQATKGRNCYGAQLFFRTSVDNFYEIEVYSLEKSAIEFKGTIDKIIKSLHFN